MEDGAPGLIVHVADRRRDVASSDNVTFLD
jgi:hypothetical protein